MKRCIGTSKDTYGLGCNEPSDNRKLGLCTDNKKCYQKFLYGTEKGQERIKRLSLKVSTKVKKEQEKKNRKETREKKIKLLTPDKYRAKYLQPVINKIARLIDYGQPCLPTGNVDGKMAGGHYLSVGSNRTTALNLHNIHIQTFHSNSWKGGDDKRYRENLIRIYGQEYFDFVDSLRQHKPLNLTLNDMIEIKKKASKLCNGLEKTKMRLSPEERIRNRNIINNVLGIYEVKFSTF